MKMEKGSPTGAVAVETMAEAVAPAPAAQAAPARPRRRRSSPTLAMGAAVEAYGEMARTRPMRLAVNASYLVIWGFIGLLGILVLT